MPRLTTPCDRCRDPVYRVLIGNRADRSYVYVINSCCAHRALECVAAEYDGQPVEAGRITIKDIPADAPIIDSNKLD